MVQDESRSREQGERSLSFYTHHPKISAEGGLMVQRIQNDEPKRCGNCFHFDEEDNGACNEYDLPVFKKMDDAACRYWMEVPDNE